MMLTWLIVIILAYFFFGLAFLGDKLVLSGPPKAITYTFYIGLLNASIFLLMPFVKFGIPGAGQVFWIVLDAVVSMSGPYVMFRALEKFEVSKVMTTIGAVQPIFILFLTWFFWGFLPMTNLEILAFILLLAGSIIISLQKTSGKTGGYLKLTMLAAVLFSLDYVFQKIVFSSMPFLQGFIWIRIFSFLFVFVFLFSKKARKQIFAKHNVARKKTGALFLSAQASGGIASILQSVAIFLAPASFLPIMNSLRGMQYVFLFLMALFFTIFFPKILKEEISKKIIFQKIIAIILIAGGLALLVL